MVLLGITFANLTGLINFSAMKSLSSQILRKNERLVVHLDIELKPLSKEADYIVGVTRNFSRGGFSFVSEYIDINPEDAIACKIMHPITDTFVHAMGVVIWNKRVGDRCIAGIKLTAMDESINSEILQYVKMKMK